MNTVSVISASGKKRITPTAIKKKLDETIVGQEEAKKTISIAVYNHYKRLEYLQKTEDSPVKVEKSNILLVGPTGSGKTYIAQTIADILSIPFVTVDATALTEAGYVGEDVETILKRLIEAADGDIQLAEKGIVYIDEIDKIAKKSENLSITRDVSGEGVQQALLKILEGTVATVPVEGNRKHPYGDMYEIDTRNILFICGGAFAGMEELLEKEPKTEKAIGFCAPVEKRNEENEKEPHELKKKLEAHDFVRYGLIPEFIGRLPVITQLNPLKKDDLVKILTEPSNAIVKQYQVLMKMDDAELVFQKQALEEIAERALLRKTGARGLRGIIEEIIKDVMFKVPDIDGEKKIVVTKKGVEDPTSIKIQSKKARRKAV